MTDIKAHCCGADMLFDEKTAKKEYAKYLKKGPDRVTAKLIEQLSTVEKGRSLIDVGGGIGAIQWWFLNQGGESVYGIDASSGYLSLAGQHALKKNWTSNVLYFMGDFTDKKDDLPMADHTTLDKVICCYPNFENIVKAACDKSHKSVSVSYPMDGIIAQAFRSVGVVFMKLKKNPFKPYIHPVRNVRQSFSNHGFKISQRDLKFPWYVETYIRST